MVSIRSVFSLFLFLNYDKKPMSAMMKAGVFPDRKKVGGLSGKASSNVPD
jgi:hypothetical protein